MGLSVIVTAYRSGAMLRMCVDRLRHDPAVTQILVGDCSPEIPEGIGVPVRRWPAPVAVPVMRWALLEEVREEVVACLEGRCVPEAGWAQKVLAAHADHPASPAIGGAVSCSKASSWLDRVVWYCEYADFGPPLADAPAADISGAHLSYKAAALRGERDLLEANAWETRIHQRWRQIRTMPAIVEFRNSLSAGDFARQRFHYGRHYAAVRATGVARLIYGLLSPVLPVILTLRTARAAARAGRVGDFLLCLPGIYVFHTLWSWGELVGYWFGASGKQRIY